MSEREPVAALALGTDKAGIIFDPAAVMAIEIVDGSTSVAVTIRLRDGSRHVIADHRFELDGRSTALAAASESAETMSSHLNWKVTHVTI